MGFKSQFFGSRVQTNVAVFFTDYTGIQLQIQEGASPVSQNAGDAELKGAELELNALIGGGFSLYLGASYIDAEYTRLLTSVQGITLDTDLPKTPKSKYTISPQWDLNLDNTGELRFAVDYTKTDSMFNDAPNTPLLERPSTENLGAGIHYFSPGEKYSVTLGGTDLTDDRYLTVGSVNGAEGETVGTYNPPRQWYLNFRADVSDRGLIQSPHRERAGGSGPFSFGAGAAETFSRNRATHRQLPGAVQHCARSGNNWQFLTDVYDFSVIVSRADSRPATQID